MTPFIPCGVTSTHLPHSWPEDARDDETNTCPGRDDTTHPTRLKKVRVSGLPGVRYQLFCDVCGELLRGARRNWTDLADAEALKREHERAGS